MLSRKEFLGSVLGAAAVAPIASAAANAVPAGELKFCAFADIHYFPGTFPHDNLEWLQRILTRAEQNNCSMIIHMGDFCHAPAAAHCKKYVDYYNNFHIPCYHTIGNHDDDGNTHDQTLAAYKLKCGYYYFDHGGFRFVVTDTNYFERDGEFIHYSKCNYYVSWQKDKQHLVKQHKMSFSRVPPAELAWLKETIENSPLPCIVTSHASFERANASPDGPAVRKIFDDANARNPGRVRLVINGHHHHDHVRILENIVYLDLNSASYDWQNTPHTKYPADFNAKWKLSKNTIMWDDPISAIITIAPNGFLKVEGQKSKFTLGITPQVAGYKLCDTDGRPTTPNIQSFELTMKY